MSPKTPPVPDEQVEAVASTPVDVALAEILGAESVTRLALTTGGGPGAALPPVKFDRKSTVRRVLAAITDEVAGGGFGPQNTLGALAFHLANDSNVTKPQGDAEAWDIEGKTMRQCVEEVLALLEQLVEAGLVKQNADGSYERTEEGQAEVSV
jgi:hypothetical protein